MKSAKKFVNFQSSTHIWFSLCSFITPSHVIFSFVFSVQLNEIALPPNPTSFGFSHSLFVFAAAFDSISNFSSNALNGITMISTVSLLSLSFCKCSYTLLLTVFGHCYLQLLLNSICVFTLFYLCLACGKTCNKIHGKCSGVSVWCRHQEDQPQASTQTRNQPNKN